MKRGRRRKYVEIIPVRPGFIYDRAIDLYLPVDAAGRIIPRMKISRAQREAIGELAGLTLASENPADPELVEKTFEFLLRPRPRGLPVVKAIAQARDAFAVLVENGYYQYQWYVDRLDRELLWAAAWSCRELARRLLSDPSISEAERNEGFLFLASIPDEQIARFKRAIEQQASPPLAPGDRP